MKNAQGAETEPGDAKFGDTEDQYAVPGKSCGETATYETPNSQSHHESRDHHSD